MKNESTFSNTQSNPYMSVSFTDGELLTLKAKKLLEREQWILKAETTSDKYLSYYLDFIDDLTKEIDNITIALESNGYAVQKYFDIGGNPDI